MSEITDLRKEIAELRKQISAMAVAMAELASHQAPIQYVPYTPAPPLPYPLWTQPWITYTNSVDGVTLTNSTN